jgi:hypothetical protein
LPNATHYSTEIDTIGATIALPLEICGDTKETCSHRSGFKYAAGRREGSVGDQAFAGGMIAMSSGLIEYIILNSQINEQIILEKNE